MGVPVRELKRRMDAREFIEWQVYYGLEPWGEERADLRAGIVAATVANSTPRKRGSKRYKPKHFMPRFNRQRSNRGDLKEALNKVATHYGSPTKS